MIKLKRVKVKQIIIEHLFVYALMQIKCFDNSNQNTVIKYFVHQVLQVHLDVIISIQTRKHEDVLMLVSNLKEKYQRHL